jgi:hypothetical protein
MLVNCPECLREVSDSASACPKCGAVLSRFDDYQFRQARIRANPDDNLCTVCAGRGGLGQGSGWIRCYHCKGMGREPAPRPPVDWLAARLEYEESERARGEEWSKWVQELKRNSVDRNR